MHVSEYVYKISHKKLANIKNEKIVRCLSKFYSWKSFKLQTITYLWHKVLKQRFLFYFILFYLGNE